MATRRYHKKRVGRKSRKVGKGRKSRRVRGGKLMKGGGLRPGPANQKSDRIDLKTIPIHGDEGFNFLNDKIRTKTGFDIYKIEIGTEINTDLPLMKWIPIAGDGLRQASYVKNQFVKGITFGLKGRTPLEEFKQNIADIYKQPNLLPNFSTLDTNVPVMLKPDGIIIGETEYPATKPLTEYDFKVNVVNFYRNLSD